MLKELNEALQASWDYDPRRESMDTRRDMKSKNVEVQILQILQKEQESRRSVSQVERDGFLFLMAEFLWIAFWLTIGVSWAVCSQAAFHSLALSLTFTWLFWTVFLLGLLVYTPCIGWWAYQRGVFDDEDGRKKI